MTRENTKPNFYIIGGPKCGTTSLAHYLSEHPDICFSDPKEPNYFNTDFSETYRGGKKTMKVIFRVLGKVQSEKEVFGTFIPAKRCRIFYNIIRTQNLL